MVTFETSNLVISLPMSNPNYESLHNLQKDLINILCLRDTDQKTDGMETLTVLRLVEASLLSSEQAKDLFKE